MKPTVGRIVHYTSYGSPVRTDGTQDRSECRAAIVTAVGDGNDIDLCVLNPSGLFFNLGVRADGNKRGGTWHWPERVE